MQPSPIKIVPEAKRETDGGKLVTRAHTARQTRAAEYQNCFLRPVTSRMISAPIGPARPSVWVIKLTGELIPSPLSPPRSPESTRENRWLGPMVARAIAVQARQNKTSQG